MGFRDELNKFFESSKKKLRSSDITICMGNEACDIDSFISSLVISMHEKCIHIVNMRREILESKGDLMFILKYFEISLDDLIYLERPVGDFSMEARKLGSVFKSGDLEYKLNDKNIRLMIVDHNRPIVELDDATIDLIIDHHTLSGSALKARRIYVDIDIGSCSTLVSKFIGHSLTSAKNNKNPDFVSSFFCEHIARLLIVPIFLDTRKLSAIASHFDKGEFKKLKKMSGMKMKEIRFIRRGIRKARLNDSKLQSEIIMQKDYKEYRYRGLTFGCATVKYDYERWVDREMEEYGKKGAKNGGVFLEAFLNQFRRDHGLDFLFVNRKSKASRYIIVVNCLLEKLIADEQGFKPISYKGLRYYSIKVSLSRKILMPLIQDILDRVNLTIPEAKKTGSIDLQQIKEAIDKTTSQ